MSDRSLKLVKLEMLRNMLKKVNEAEQLCKAKPELRPRMCKALAHFVTITLELCEIGEHDKPNTT